MCIKLCVASIVETEAVASVNKKKSFYFAGGGGGGGLHLLIKLPASVVFLPKLLL
jgi:hypothetical protein